MFLGNLSTTTERTARKKTASKQKSQSGRDYAVASTEKNSFLDKLLFSNDMSNSIMASYVPVEDSLGKRVNQEDRVNYPMIYSKEGNSEIPREILLRYLKDCSFIILQEQNVCDIIADSENQDIGLHEAAVLYQQDVLEYNYQIERKFGCQYLSSISVVFPTDEELLDASYDYIYAALRSYLMGLNIRHKKALNTGKPLITDGSFKRTHMLEFFEACTSLNAMKEIKIHLRELFETTKKVPNERIISLQRSLLEVVGYDADFAVSQLNVVSSNYSNDAEVITKMQHFAINAQLICKEATMSESERGVYEGSMPRIMHHYPHLFVIQQQRQMHQQQMMMQQQQKMVEATGASELFKSEEGRGKVQGLIERLKEAMTVITERDLSSWTDSDRESFFQKFSKHPMLDAMSEGGDAMTRISKLFELSDEDLKDIVTMQIVMAEDMKANGSIAKQIREAQAQMWSIATRAAKEGGGAVPSGEGVATSLLKVGGILASLGSLANMGRPLGGSPMSPHQGHSHDHGGHGHSCSIHPPRPIASDVTSGKAEKMIR